MSGVFAGLLAAGLAAGAGAAEPAPDTLVMNSCTSCHDSKRICNSLGNKNDAAWKTTIDRMVKKGAKLSAAEQQAVLAYLAKLPPASQPVCPK
jgi:hypothetical protein